MIVLYHIFLWAYRSGVLLLSLFDVQAQRFLRGRVNLLSRAKKDLKQVSGKRIWMHCASWKEFETGLPVLKKLIREDPGLTPVITFFSPSGYKAARSYGRYPYIYYLPMDSYVNARQWLRICAPTMVLWVKHEYWHFFLREIHRKKIPLFLISAVYRRNQIFFRWYGGFYRKMLGFFTHFFVQDVASQRFLSTVVPRSRITVAGDTACDDALDTAKNFLAVPEISLFIKNRKMVLLASTLEGDEDVWSHYINNHPDIVFFIMPRPVTRARVRGLQNRFKRSASYSGWMKGNTAMHESDTHVMILDDKSKVSAMYGYATLAYAGGGFDGLALSYLWQPAAFGCALIFGPAFYQTPEAAQLLHAGGAVSVGTALELEKVATALLHNEEQLKNIGSKARAYAMKHAGASQTVANFIMPDSFPSPPPIR